MTQREYTGAEFEIEFARAWLEYVVGGKVGVDPWTQWEHKNGVNLEWRGHESRQWPNFGEGVFYRWKPAAKRMVTIGYFKKTGVHGWIEKELVAPEVEAPKDGTTYFRFFEPAYAQTWSSDSRDAVRLASGEVFLTREDAQAMAEWLAVCRKGGAA